MRLIAKAVSERGVAVAVLPSSAWNKLWAGAEHEGVGAKGGWRGMVNLFFWHVEKRATLIYAETSSDSSWIFMVVSQRELWQRKRGSGEEERGGGGMCYYFPYRHGHTCAIHSHSIRTSFSYLLCQFVFQFFPDNFTPGKLTRRDISSIDWVNFNQTAKEGEGERGRERETYTCIYGSSLLTCGAHEGQLDRGSPCPAWARLGPGSIWPGTWAANETIPKCFPPLQHSRKSSIRPLVAPIPKSGSNYCLHMCNTYFNTLTHSSRSNCD